MQGRILTVYLMINFGLQPISSQLVGWVGQTLGAPAAILAHGTMMAGLALLGVLRPGLAAWEPGPAEAGSAAPGTKAESG